jgi:hypothetical protein
MEIKMMFPALVDHETVGGLSDRIMDLSGALTDAIDMLDKIAKGGSFNAKEFLDRVSKQRATLQGKRFKG